MIEKFSANSAGVMSSQAGNSQEQERSRAHACGRQGIPTTSECPQFRAEKLNEVVKPFVTLPKVESCCWDGAHDGHGGTVIGAGEPPIPRASPSLEMLSRAERVVLSLLACGLRVADVALSLSRSPKTISTQKLSIMRKFGAKNDFELHKIIYQLRLAEGLPLNDCNASELAAGESQTCPIK
jgi:DNA-binding NarL/FixJ family response regulator